MTLKRIFIHFNWLLEHYWVKRSPHIKSDEFYLRVMFFIRVHQILHLNNPKTFNEKLQWLKLYAHKSEYVIMADKVKAKEYVAEKIGAEYIIPTLGVWESADEVDFSSLPEKFVIKCNHNSGRGMYICMDKSKMDENAVRDGLRQGLNEDYFLPGRDKQYRDIPRRILAECFMEDKNQPSLIDYKVLCFNGEPKLIEVHLNRFTDNYTQDFYDISWKKQNIWQPGDKNSNIVMDKPLLLDKMIGFSRILSADCAHLRVDWYIINNHLYFGEMTFFDAGGFLNFCPRKWNRILGDWIHLPDTKTAQ